MQKQLADQDIFYIRTGKTVTDFHQQTHNNEYY